MTADQIKIIDPGFIDSQTIIEEKASKTEGACPLLSNSI
jgi:hypothetical protein